MNTLFTLGQNNTDRQAMTEFLTSPYTVVGERARAQLLDQLDGPALAEPRLLRFTTGHRKRFWVHNVAALGLSSGFLEPLESTSILLIQQGLFQLIDMLKPGAPPAAAAMAAYNKGMANMFARIRDFIILH